MSENGNYSFQNVRQCIITRFLRGTAFQSCRVIQIPESTEWRRLLVPDTEDVLEQSAEYKITELFTDSSQRKYAKMNDPLTGFFTTYIKIKGRANRVEQTPCRVEQTRWRSWADSQNWADSLSELSRRIELTRWRSWAKRLSSTNNEAELNF